MTEVKSEEKKSIAARDVGFINHSWKDLSSAYGFHEKNEQMAREYQIAIEGMNITREKLAHCVRTEGVNQFVKCKELREKYWLLCQDRFRGMVLPEDMITENRRVPGLIVGKGAPPKM